MTELRPAGAPPLRAVFIDLGDTLMHIHPSVPELYAEACADLGVPATPADIRAALAGAEAIYHDAVRTGRGFESSLDDARAFWGEYNGAVLAGLGADPADRGAFAERLTERFWSPHAWRLFPEAVEVLGELRDAGLSIAIVSNFTDALITVCETHALDGMVDHILASTVVGSQKPDVGIFRDALRRTGVGPDEVVHVGDNYVADVLGARAAGIHGILLDRTRAGTPGMFDFTTRTGIGGSTGTALDCPVISDLRDLLALLPVRG